MILIIGNARSGTSWLGKIFDSHPDVVYRHEPDSSVPCYEFPFVVEEEDYGRYRKAASLYLGSLRYVRTIRAVARRPVFPKAYHSAAAAYVRVSLISLMQVLARTPALGGRIARMNAPDLIAAGHRPRFVVKSVVSLGRAGLYSRALDDGRIVFIVRHPCGVVASQLRGMKLGKLKHETPFQAMSGSSVGRRYGLSVPQLESLTREEQIAWTWVVMNEHAAEGLAGRGNALRVTHEALCLDPIGEAKRLFDFCGLPWSRQSETFLRDGLSTERTASYYDVQRNSANEVSKWKRELESDTIDRVEAILERSPLARLFT